jgi:hypothetical protein
MASARRRACVDLPEPSMPSRLMKRPELGHPSVDASVGASAVPRPSAWSSKQIGGRAEPYHQPATCHVAGGNQRHGMAEVAHALVDHQLAHHVPGGDRRGQGRDIGDLGRDLGVEQGGHQHLDAFRRRQANLSSVPMKTGARAISTPWVATSSITNWRKAQLTIRSLSRARASRCVEAGDDEGHAAVALHGGPDKAIARLLRVAGLQAIGPDPHAEDRVAVEPVGGCAVS